MEKVKLPQEVAEAIEYYKREHGDFWKHHLLSDAVECERYIGKQKFSSVIKSYTEQGGLEDILHALVNGYEVEQTPEERIREYFINRAKMYDGEIAIKVVLNILNIKISGVNTE